MDFKELSVTLQALNTTFTRQAKASVNACLTLRNWLFGFYIQEYEQSGVDRAEYGEGTLRQLSHHLAKSKVPSASRRNLASYRKFYRYYPEILQTASAKLHCEKLIGNQAIKILMNAHAKLASRLSTIAIKADIPKISGDKLMNSLSFSHFVELLQIEKPLTRRFYEVECIRNQWAVRELRRQIGSLYYERCSLSSNKEKLAQLANQNIITTDAEAVIKDPYIFEFLGLRSEEVMDENHLSDALLDKLQQFLLELGKGFCFEARQRRILIGNEYFFIDLVFYHRILKCNILIELKADTFSHQHIGQINTYLNYYKKHEMQADDNPPIGLLLCTNKNRALVEYAIADSNNQLFVSDYKLDLPSEDELKLFIERQLSKDLAHLSSKSILSDG